MGRLLLRAVLLVLASACSASAQAPMVLPGIELTSRQTVRLTVSPVDRKGAPAVVESMSWASSDSAVAVAVQAASPSQVSIRAVGAGKAKVCVTADADMRPDRVAPISWCTDVTVVQPPPPLPPSPLAARVLVVANALQPVSLAVAAHYMAARGVPPQNLCQIQVAGSLPDLDYLQPLETHVAIRAALRLCVAALGRRTVLYVVMTPGTPHRIWLGANGARSIDMLLGQLWDDNVLPRIANPYAANDETALSVYAPSRTFVSWRDDPLNVSPSYGVWRLWGRTEAEANAFVDDAVAVERAGGLRGRACFDARYGRTTGFWLPDTSYVASDNDLLAAASATRAVGIETVLDVNEAEFGTAPAPLRCENAALYAGWYNYGGYNDAFSFARGAVGWHLDSLSVGWADGAVKRGVVATAGTIEEPLMGLYALPRPDRVVRDLLSGALVSDAYQRAMGYVDKLVLIGDPLYRPFPKP